jgi:PAS domain S-box-containing protein
VVNRLLPNSVRGLQLFVLAVALVPVVLLQIGIYANWLDVRRSSEVQTGMEVARGVAATFDAYIRDVSNQQLAIGLAFTGGIDTREGAQRFLAANAELFPPVRDFSWVDPLGVISASSRSELVGTDISSQPSYLAAVGRDRLAVSDLLQDWHGDGPTFLITTAIRGEAGALLGAVTSSVDPDRMDSVLAIPREDGGAIALIDSSGRGVYRYPPVTLTWEQRDWLPTDPELPRALAGEEQTATIVSRLDGIERIASRTPVHSVGWVASASRPVEAVMAPVVQGFLWDAGMLLLVALSALLVALLVASKLTEPLLRLKENAAAVGRGELGGYFSAAGPAEVQALGDAFNTMARELAFREEQQSELMKNLSDINQRLVVANAVQKQLADEARRAEEELRARERQQAAIAGLGQHALSGVEAPALMKETVELVAQTLEADCAKVLELLPGGDRMLLVAGVGWKEGLEGVATVDTGSDSQAGYTLNSDAPVIVEDLRTETRFSGPPLLHDHGIVSGISVVIRGGNGPYGVLGVHTTSPRLFTLDDVYFVQAVANVLGSAVQRQRIEEQLRTSKDQLEVILGGIANGITVQSGSGELIYANDAAARMIGFPSAEELLRTPPREVMARFEVEDEDGRPVGLEQLPGWIALRGQEGPQVVLRYRVLATGDERWAMVKASPVFDGMGRVQFAVNIFQDITDRKRAEDAQRFLSEASALLGSSLNYEATLSRVARLAVPRIADWCSVHLVDQDGGVQRLAVAHANPDKVRFAEELQRKFPPNPESGTGVYRVLRTGEPEVYPEITDELLAASAQDEEHLRILREVGMRSAMVVPLVARGRILGAITLISAESGRRYGPSHLDFAQHLARRSALAVDNARLYREAQEAVQVRNQLFSSISHDLKNPLTGIKGTAQLLRRMAQRLDVPEAERLVQGLGSIDAATTRMAEQINELVDLARLQVGQPLDLNRQPTDLVALTRDIAAQHQHAASRHRIEVSAAVDELTGDWDRVRLGRVVSNLIANAIKYSPQGGRIAVTVMEERSGEDASAVLAVRDEGMGIPADDLSRIFKGFHRGANVAGKIAGTGIGLFGARHIVELHGGSILVESEEGVGSTFTVRLPLAPEREGAAGGTLSSGARIPDAA